ncbi:MAG: O-antigen ligase family protein [Blastochloris sp.]|nr:O-antigen ligase family protein [Blastochloris sp.]
MVLVWGIQFLPGLDGLSGSWRSEAEEVYGIELGSAVSPQPWLSLDHGGWVMLGLLWLMFAAEVTPTAEQRHGLLRWFGVGAILFSVLVLLVHYLGLEVPGWQSPKKLGPFESRNLLSSFLSLALLILMALFTYDMRKRFRLAMLWLGGGAVVFYLLVLNFSRSGLVLIFLGGLIWVGLNFKSGVGMTRLTKILLALMVMASAFLLFGGETLERFNTLWRGSEDSASLIQVGRGVIQKDTLKMIQDQPWLGVGLGNFDAVFPQYREALKTESFIVHPESDWLWVWAEMGVFGLAAFVLVAVAWWREVWPLSHGTDKHFRSACAVAVMMGVIHGFVDVPWHRLGNGLADCCFCVAGD